MNKGKYGNKKLERNKEFRLRKGSERRDELERDAEGFKIGLLLRNARELKQLI